MHLVYFRYLSCIEQEHSISSAARRLGLHQSTLSSIVASIENELGFPLFERAPWGVTPSTSGKKFISSCRSLLPLCEELCSLQKHKQKAVLTEDIPNKKIPLKIETLRYLLTINQYCSISTAAKRLYVGQAALSTSLKQMEALFGFAFFKRTAKGVIPTASGARVIELAKTIVLQYGRTVAYAGETMLPDPVTVILSPSFSSFLPLKLHPDFARSYPWLPLVFSTAPRHEIFSLLVKNRAQIGVVHMLEEELDQLKPVAKRYQLTFRLCCRDRFILVANQSLSFPCDHSGPSFLKGLELATVDGFASVSFYYVMTSVFQQFRRSTVFPDVQQAISAVRTYGMCAVLTESVLRGLHLYEDPSLHFLAIEDLFSTPPRGSSIDCYLLHRESVYLRGSEQFILAELDRCLKRDSTETT